MSGIRRDDDAPAENRGPVSLSGGELADEMMDSASLAALVRGLSEKTRRLEAELARVTQETGEPRERSAEPARAAVMIAERSIHWADLAPFPGRG